MNIQPKSQEGIHAQIAAFADRHFDRAGHNNEQWEDKNHLLANMSSLAVQEAADVSRVTRENIRDGSGSIVVPAGSEKVIATPEDYTKFLREAGGSRNEAIQNRAALIKAYEPFVPKVAELKNALTDHESRKKHPEFLAHGSNSYTFLIQHEGRPLVVRIPNGKVVNHAHIDMHFSGAVLGKGIPHLEQIIAASYEDGVTVAEVMPGKELAKNMTVEDIRQITDDQLEQLVDTLITTADRGLNIDPKPDNIFYDANEGFGLIDYSAANSPYTAQNHRGKLLGSVGSSIMNVGFFGRTEADEPDSAEDFARDLALRTTDRGVLERYKAIVERKLDGDDLQIALEQIDRSLKDWQEDVDNYSDPAWVAKKLAGEPEQSNSGIDPFEVW